MANATDVAGGSGGRGSSMTLTPDGSKLVVASASGNTPHVTVLDPDNISSPSVLPYSGSLSGSIAATNLNTVIFAGTPAVVLDLSTSKFLPLGGNLGQVMRASADGSHVYNAILNVSSGEVSSIDPATNAVASQSFGELFWTDLAVSADGSQVAAVDAPPYAAGDLIGFFDSSLRYLNSNVYPIVSPPSDAGVVGATFSPGGKVLVVALGNSIEFWDSAHGTLRARLLTPEELEVIVYPEGSVAPTLALDSTGQTIYAVSASGISVLTLPTPLDQMTPITWPPFESSGTAKAALQGTLSSRVAAMHSKSPK
jgi:DNA-binding beta-propeller fold protein YncE